MRRGRALLTPRERKLLSDEDSDGDRYIAASHVRTKLNEELPTDIEILEEHHPVLLDELREKVCEDR